MGFKEDVDYITDVIVSCWDSNQECDENGKPLDGLTFDERLDLKIKELEDDKKDLMDKVLDGV